MNNNSNKEMLLNDSREMKNHSINKQQLRSINKIPLNKIAAENYNKRVSTQETIGTGQNTSTNTKF